MLIFSRVFFDHQTQETALKDPRPNSWKFGVPRPSLAGHFVGLHNESTFVKTATWVFYVLLSPKKKWGTRCQPEINGLRGQNYDIYFKCYVLYICIYLYYMFVVVKLSYTVKDV